MATDYGSFTVQCTKSRCGYTSTMAELVDGGYTDGIYWNCPMCLKEYKATSEFKIAYNKYINGGGGSTMSSIYYIYPTGKITLFDANGNGTDVSSVSLANIGDSATVAFIDSNGSMCGGTLSWLYNGTEILAPTATTVTYRGLKITQSASATNGIITLTNESGILDKAISLTVVCATNSLGNTDTFSNVSITGYGEMEQKEVSVDVAFASSSIINGNTTTAIVMLNGTEITGNTDDAELKYTIGDSNIISYDPATHIVTGIGAGTTTLTFSINTTTMKGSGSASIEVVKQNTIAITPASFTIDIGETQKLEFVVNGEVISGNTKDAGIVATIADTSKASYDPATQEITVLASGTTSIGFTYTDTAGAVSQDVSVTGIAYNSYYFAVSPTTFQLIEGQTSDPLEIATYANGNIKGSTSGILIYNLSNANVATYNHATRTITAVGAGNATITLWTKNKRSKKVLNVEVLTQEQWDTKYATITFEANGGKGTMDKQYIVRGTRYTIPQCAFTPPNYKGLTENQWDLYKAGQSIIVDDSFTLTAQYDWTESHLAITPSTIDIVAGSSVKLAIENNLGEVADLATSGIGFSKDATLDSDTFDEATMTLSTTENGTRSGNLTFTYTQSPAPQTTKQVAVNISELAVDIGNLPSKMIVGDETPISITTNGTIDSVVIGDENIATYDSTTGILTAVGRGDTALTVTYSNGTISLTKEYAIVVRYLDTTLDITGMPDTIYQGDTATIEINTNATDYTLTIDDGQYLAYDKDTKTFTSTGVGLVNVTISAEANGYEPVSQTFEVLCDMYATTLELLMADGSAIGECFIDSSSEWQILINGTKATESDYTYEVSATDIMTWTPSTNIAKFLEIGTSTFTITARASENHKYATLTKTITTEYPPTQIEVTGMPDPAYIGEQATLAVTTNAASWTYSNSNDTVIYFDKTSMILTPRTLGESVLTFTATANRCKTTTLTYRLQVYNRTTLNISGVTSPLRIDDIVSIALETNDPTYTVTFEPEGILTWDRDKRAFNAIAIGSTSVTFSAEVADSIAQTQTYDIVVEAKPPTTLEITNVPSAYYPDTPVPAQIRDGDSIILDIQTDADDFEYRVSDENVIVFGKSAKRVTAVGVGTATLAIRATANRCVETIVSLNIEVTEKPYTDITAENMPTQIRHGDTATGISIVTNAPNYTYKVGDTTLIDYDDERGQIYAKRVGTTSITYTAIADRCQKTTLVCDIEVTAKPYTKLTASKESVTLMVGEGSSTLTITTNADSWFAKTSSRDITIEQDAENNTLVVNSGMLVGDYYVYVYATADRHYETVLTIPVHIVSSADTVTIEPTEVLLLIGATSEPLTITMYGKPINEDTKDKLTYTATGEDIATYDPDTYTFTAIGAGEAVYTFTDGVREIPIKVLTAYEITTPESDTTDRNDTEIRTADEIYADYKDFYFKLDNYPYTKITDKVKLNMPRYLRENNDEFYTYIEKITSYRLKMMFWVWILGSMFWVKTAKGKWLDNIGRWLGMSRPPLPTKRTVEPVVIYPPTLDNTEMTPEELLDFNTLHGLTGKGDTDVKDTFYPSREFVGNVLVDDDEYRTYILGLLQVKNGLSMDIIIDSFAHILTKPFFIVKNDTLTAKDGLKFIASYYEDSVRLVIVREMTAKLRTTGFNIEVTQAQEPEPEDIKKLYGEFCWKQSNPYIDEE